MADTYDQLSLLSDLIDSALKQGADAADAVVSDASSVSVSYGWESWRSSKDRKATIWASGYL